MKKVFIAHLLYELFLLVQRVKIHLKSEISSFRLWNQIISFLLTNVSIFHTDHFFNNNIKYIMRVYCTEYNTIWKATKT